MYLDPVLVTVTTPVPLLLIADASVFKPLFVPPNTSVAVWFVVPKRMALVLEKVTVSVALVALLRMVPVPLAMFGNLQQTVGA